MVMEAVESLGVWSWFVLGVVLLGVEILVPGTFILWLGFAALVVGVVVLAVDMSWQAQLLLFAALSVVFVVAWWKVARRRPAADSDQPMLNRRAERHVGRVFELDAPIVAGLGRVRIDDTLWRVSGPDLPAGARIRVISADGATLVVEQVA